MSISKRLFALLEDGHFCFIFNDQTNPNEIKGIESYFSTPTSLKKLNFNSEYNLADNEEFVFSQTANDSQILPLVQKYIDVLANTVNGHTVKDCSDSLAKIVCFCFSEKIGNIETIKFSRVFKKYKLTNKKVLGIIGKGKPEVIEINNQIEFSGIVDAYWDGKILSFRKFNNISSLFDGAHLFYRKANEIEVKNFLTQSWFNLSQDYDVNTIHLRSSKKIAQLVDSKRIDFSNPQLFAQITTNINQFPSNKLNIQKGKIIISNNEDINEFLKYVESKYYYSLIDGEPMEALATQKAQ
ncbi:hypothetical protein IQR32_01545 [Acinetobacter albensis]|uniref:hypothetical protein n=1 Tax=Acinetobacter albensis TaxID=1673609 RepID=UPI0018811227|nr:hypothetical protein [Acinetobacter albensis]MBE9400048.1 hypothetical protein [Acinetobacter albensis]